VSDAVTAGPVLAAQAKGATAESPHRRREDCRGCGGRRLAPFLSLGPQPLANAFLRGAGSFADERFYPLDVFFCDDCALVQVLDVIDPAVLFDHYLYVTGTSETMARHNREHAGAVQSLLALGARDLVVEVASNDGSLLSCYRALGIRTLGVEPARNIAALARERGVDTVNRFFDGRAGRELRDQFGPARAVLANNVLAHVDDPLDFLRGCRDLLSSEGLVIVEVPYAGDMLDRIEYDTIYHEHLCYFALGPLARMAAAVGLRIVRADRLDVHGGSLRVFFGHGAGDSSDVSEFIASERRRGVTVREAWERFGLAAGAHRRALLDLLSGLARQGASLGGYGAPAKGNTLLNFCGIGPPLLPFTVDRNPLKVGLFTPGTHVPVLSVDALETRRPSHVLILAWNFADEIVRQQPAHAARGGRWLVPIPHPRELAPPA
jgi:hypothetical protein